METSKVEIYNEEEFHIKFKVKRNHIDKNACFDGCMYETFGKELAYVYKMIKKNRVVTIIEGDNEEKEITFFDSKGVKVNEVCTTSNLYYESGFHSINRLVYFVLDKPYQYEFEVKVD